MPENASAGPAGISPGKPRGNRGRAMPSPGPAEMTADPEGLSVRIEAADAEAMMPASSSTAIW